MLKPIGEYSVLQKAAVTIGASILIPALSYLASWVESGTPKLDSELSIINALIMPPIFLWMYCQADTNIGRRRRDFACVILLFCGYLLCLSASLYTVNFPASGSLFRMPVITTLLLIPWAGWNYYMAKTAGTGKSAG